MEINTDLFQNSLDVYERLKNNTYQIDIENNTSFKLKFKDKAYHHLMGFQHLTDLNDIADPKFGTKRFYTTFKAHSESIGKTIKGSALYPVISERVESFSTLEELLAPGEYKLIVDFDNSKNGSLIEADYFLFKRVGAQFSGNVVYYNLFLGHDTNDEFYYPATYIVEHSNLYIRDQTILDCSVSLV